MKTKGNKILITGGATGIGFATARMLIQQGNTVISIDRNPENQNNAKKLLPELITHLADLCKTEEVLSLADWVSENHRDLNILINNAGVQYNYELDGKPAHHEEITREITINLITLILLSEALLPVLKNQPQAKIVNITSGLAMVPKKSAPVYCASKAGLHNFSRALNYQLEDSSVKVVEVIPPLVDTKMTRGRGSKKATPEAVAYAILFGITHGKLEVNVGKVKMLRTIKRVFPNLAYAILKNN